MMDQSTGQTAFRAALLDAAQPVPDGLLDGHGQPAGRRYSVYRNNVAVSLRDALGTGFPAIARILGPDNFAKAASLYLRAEPPSSPLMMHYGAGFPTFLAALEPLAYLGYLADVARLELALRASYHAADAPALDPARLQTLGDDALPSAQFVTAPAVRVIRSKWPVLSLYRAQMEPDHPKPANLPEDVLIARPGFDPVLRLLPKGGADFVTALQNGDAFATALNHAGEDFDLPATLGLLLETGALIDIKTKD